VTPQPGIEFLEKELLVKRLNAIQRHLWSCGRPMPGRPLHTQVLLGRAITITENMELHLVWSKNRMFIKPMPRYLLDPTFWSTHLIPSESGSDKDSDMESRRQNLLGCALGFLFSYTGLIAYESDFRLAQDNHLLPDAVKWESWKELCSQFLSHHCYASVNPRYWYGELRLTRLNKVYRFKMGAVLRGYSKVADNAFYDDVLRDNFAALASVLAYVAIALTAMQLGLATDKLGHNDSFQSASYGFTVLSIFAPLIAGVGIALGVLILVVSNWMATKSYERKRFREMGVEPLSKTQGERHSKTGK
jgi:hypothetical protein